MLVARRHLARPLTLHRVRKAEPPRTARHLLPVQSKAQNRLVKAFVEMVKAVRGRTKVKDLVEALKTGHPSTVDSVLDIETSFNEVAEGAGIEPGEPSFLRALRTTFMEGAVVEMQALRNMTIEKGVGLSLAFDERSPEAEAFISQYKFGLIKGISQDARRAIRSIVLQAFILGGNPREQARDIRRTIGLTSQQATALLNFKSALQSEATMAQVLQRALRDRRFDSTILFALRNNRKLTQAQIDRMVIRYHERLLQHRALMIARTETIRATNAGQLEVWRQAEQQGLIKREKTRRKWILSVRPCPICVSISVSNRKGVAIDEPFIGPNGPVRHPPAHPHCRCSMKLVTRRN